ncbi:fungal-specific transcription factor domain-containing protein [Apiospora kogelbergensis]|uniref:fungal-specific transcription factor domain-containing protein n=1 Tax=Apiospora kogelbergensis TaxID=1337665 RepID=UPI00312E1303
MASSMPSDALGRSASRDEEGNGSDQSPATEGNGDSVAQAAGATSANSSVPKPKRLACMICRKRKLKCDGVKPSCSTCTRLGHTCAYDEVRRKSGPKRGYVKALEERLKLVESLLQTPESSSARPNNTTMAPKEFAKPSTPVEPRTQPPVTAVNLNIANPAIAIASDNDMDRWHFNGDSPQPGAADDFNFNTAMPMDMNLDSSFTWEMIGLGLEEPLPPQETIDELHQIYFDKSLRERKGIAIFFDEEGQLTLHQSSEPTPPVALRYAMWTLSCSVAEKYAGMMDLFYQRARKYVEADYVKGYGEHMISVAHAQTHILLASYEFKMMYFPRAWMNTGSAARLCQMIGLHRLDGTGLDVKQCLPPPRDWTEREERRRTFWMAFCQDRYASIGTGWPMTFDERDIMTDLPASEKAVVLMACLFGRNLIHLHRPDANDRDHDHNGEFWKRHRNMDNILLNTSLCLPNSLKLPTGLSNPNIIFTNMNIHTSTICLHQAAIFKADKYKLPSSVSSESKVRCITAANEIASIMRMVSHMDLSVMNPFLSFCLYVAARVFVQYLKSRPEDSQVADSLRFLLAAMNALKRKNPLTESFLVQLDVDLEALGARIPTLRTAFPRASDSPMTSQVKAKLQDHARLNQQFEKAGVPTNPYNADSAFPGAQGDPGSSACRPEVVRPETGIPGTGGRMSTGYNAFPWDSMPAGEPSSGRRSNEDNALPGMSLHNAFTAGGNSLKTNGFVESQGTSSHELSVSPHPDSLSSRPTPNSSGTSDQPNCSSAQVTVGSGRTSFEASPEGPITTQSEMDAAATTFFTASSEFGLSGAGPGMTPGRGFIIPEMTGNDFTMPSSWDQAQDQPEMTPIAEGVLRNLMNMPPMDAMDLGWDSGT